VTEKEEMRGRLHEHARMSVGFDWTDVVAGVVADYVREMRAANRKLTDQIEHLKRLHQLTEIRSRAPNKENRAIKNHISSLYLQVSELGRAGKK
jgi:predicted small metal-binding protein